MPYLLVWKCTSDILALEGTMACLCPALACIYRWWRAKLEPDQCAYLNRAEGCHDIRSVPLSRGWHASKILAAFEAIYGGMRTYTTLTIITWHLCYVPHLVPMPIFFAILQPQVASIDLFEPLNLPGITRGQGCSPGSDETIKRQVHERIVALAKQLAIADGRCGGWLRR